jgi:putative phage-type endonuclease
MLTLEQQLRRQSSIGASEVAAILGLDTKKTGLDVWLSKRGAPVVQQESEASLMGNLLEPIVAQRYSMVHPDRKLLESETLYGSEPYFTATPDRIVQQLGDPARYIGGVEQEWLLEIKTRSMFTAKTFGAEGTDQVPPEVLCQVMWQMGIAGMDYAEVALLVDGRRYAEYAVNFDREAFAAMQEQAKAWWVRHIINGEEPEIRGTAAVSYLRDKFREVDSEVLIADESDEALMAHYHRAQQAVKQAEAVKEEMQSLIMQRIGNASGVRGQTGSLSWRPQRGRTTVDYAGIVRSLNVPEDLIQSYTRVGPDIRVLRFTPNRKLLLESGDE